MSQIIQNRAKPIPTFKSTHDLPFLNRVWHIDTSWFEFKIGTVHGLWHYDKSIPAYCILAIKNDSPGNGHLEDVFEWFEATCRREKCPLIIEDITNERFYNHLVFKRGFIGDGKKVGSIRAIKYFTPTA